MVEPKPQECVTAANAKFQASGFAVEVVAVTRLLFLNRNAHYIPAETYKLLVSSFRNSCYNSVFSHHDS